MNKLNQAMQSIRFPDRINRLPISTAGYPVPWFVQWVKDGKPVDPGEGDPDFRIIDSAKYARAINKQLCWVCGEKLGVHLTFAIGPMCAINRITSEPPCHHECALFAATACPFLSNPRMRRNEKDLPDERYIAGEHIDRNPGAMCLWTTRTFKVFKVDNGVLIEIGSPSRVEWYAKGRPALRAEVTDSIESGYPILLALARRDGDEAVIEIEQRKSALAFVLPKERSY
jgi:hypothetical protein